MTRWRSSSIILRVSDRHCATTPFPPVFSSHRSGSDGYRLCSVPPHKLWLSSHDKGSSSYYTGPDII